MVKTCIPLVTYQWSNFANVFHAVGYVGRTSCVKNDFPLVTVTCSQDFLVTFPSIQFGRTSSVRSLPVKCSQNFWKRLPLVTSDVGRTLLVKTFFRSFRVSSRSNFSVENVFSAPTVTGRTSNCVKTSSARYSDSPNGTLS
ncbi:hypothetical protein AVEN_188642-1 [Araneus ventricosus]|uniref:Uncharacterized protein n=1 Tax=Araneus ventricosus TaxID=182803 RepID=A0A4Y2RWV0_ARAVE|nr:hypothetical protein AVEN_188642-1 [Araneus ventricosus]